MSNQGLKCTLKFMSVHLLILTDSNNNLTSDVCCREFGKVWGKNDLPHSFTNRHSTVWPLSATWSASFWSHKSCMSHTGQVFSKVTHRRRCCLLLSTLARRSSSSCRRLATCRSCCTRRLLWTLEARWLSTGRVKEEKPFRCNRRLRRLTSYHV